jgi:hypothetical protein
MPPLTETDVFNSNIDNGLISYRILPLTEILGQDVDELFQY